MIFNYPKNVIVIAAVVAALLGATVLLGGFAQNKEAVNDAEAAAKTGCCPAMGKTAVCPAMAGQAASFAKMAAAEAESSECDKTPCTTECPKPCCAGEDVEGACDNPCDIPCPKPCCAESAGCPMTAAETNVQ